MMSTDIPLESAAARFMVMTVCAIHVAQDTSHGARNRRNNPPTSRVFLPRECVFELALVKRGELGRM